MVAVGDTAGVGRVVRCAVALIVGSILAVGCSGDDKTAGPPEPPPSESSVPGGTSSPTVATVPAPTVTTPPAGPSAPVPPGPTVAESGGWRLAVTRPTAGATIGRVAVLCYEVSGTSREPVVALEVTLFPPGSTTGANPVRIEGSVGRGSVRVDLAGAPTGRYDLGIQLIVNGERLENMVVRIPMVTLAAGAAAIACS